MLESLGIAERRCGGTKAKEDSDEWRTRRCRVMLCEGTTASTNRLHRPLELNARCEVDEARLSAAEAAYVQ